MFLPFLGEQFNLFFSTVLLGGYYFIALLITYVVVETAHVRNLSPYVLMAAAACLARVCLAAALLGGHAIGSLPGGLFGESEHIMRYLVVIMAVIYALSLAAVLVSRDRRHRRRGDADAGSSAAAAAPAGAVEARLCRQAPWRRATTRSMLGARPWPQRAASPSARPRSCAIWRAAARKPTLPACCS